MTSYRKPFSRFGTRLAVSSVALVIAVCLGSPAAPALAKSCGEIDGASGRALRLSASKTSCRNARSVMARYYRKVVQGECSGSLCGAQVGKYTCFSNTAVREQDTGIASECTYRQRLIRTRVIR